MDYLVADRWLIPYGAENFYAERVLRMPDGYVCYAPPSAAGEVGCLPAVRQGGVVFGSFSRPAKIQRTTVCVWASILRRVPGSRLVLKHAGFDDATTIRRFREMFHQEGVEPERLEMLRYTSASTYFDEYRRIDVMLDPFPHGGGLTTCGSLWMGVPVVTWPGETFASRQSLSHLSNIGLTETIASSAGDYVELAVGLVPPGRDTCGPARADGRFAALRRPTVRSELDDAAPQDMARLVLAGVSNNRFLTYARQRRCRMLRSAGLRWLLYERADRRLRPADRRRLCARPVCRRYHKNCWHQKIWPSGVR